MLTKDSKADDVETAGASPLAAAPSVWLVIGDKLGDNAQLEALTDCLGWPATPKRLRFREEWVTGKPPFRASLYHVDLEHSDPLMPPWPDLVLTIGRRPSMAALWIRRQSGGHTKVVIIGRPRRHLDEFALVLAPPQYRLPAHANVFPLELPLMRVERRKIEAAVERWRDRLGRLPRPLTAVLVGGPTKPFLFDAAVTAELINAVERATGGHGSLFVTTSRRTPEAVVNALIAGLPPSAQLFRWHAGAEDNPYHALLGLADRFVVTGDSVSMMVEVARLGRPLAIFPLPVAATPFSRLKRWLAPLLQPAAGSGEAGPLGWLGDRLYDLGLITYARDFEVLHRRLVERGLAVWLGGDWQVQPAPAPDDVERAAARIRALVGR